MQASCCAVLVTAVSVERANLTAGPGQCPACTDRTAFKEMTKRTIKEEILRKLGFSAAPNVTGKYFTRLPVVQKQIEEVILKSLLTCLQIVDFCRLQVMNESFIY